MDEFSTNLQRAAVAHLHLLCGMTAAREMFGKSYFSLAVAEKTAVDQTVLGPTHLRQSHVSPRSHGLDARPKCSAVHH